MNVRNKRTLVISLGILITVAFPVIGWFAVGLLGMYNGVTGCAGLGWAAAGAIILGLLGFFLGGFINGRLQPITEDTDSNLQSRETKFYSLLYSAIVLLVLIILIGLTFQFDVSDFWLNSILLLIITALSWFGSRIGFSKQLSKKKENRAQP